MTEEVKVKKPVFHYFVEPVDKKNPKLSNFNKARRVVAVAMTYDTEGNCKYGAAIFHREANRKDEVVCKKALRQTAEGRFFKHPVEVKLPEGLNHEQITKFVRKTMYTKGVKSTT